MDWLDGIYTPPTDSERMMLTLGTIGAALLMMLVLLRRPGKWPILTGLLGGGILAALAFWAGGSLNVVVWAGSLGALVFFCIAFAGGMGARA